MGLALFFYCGDKAEIEELAYFLQRTFSGCDGEAMYHCVPSDLADLDAAFNFSDLAWLLFSLRRQPQVDINVAHHLFHPVDSHCLLKFVSSLRQGELFFNCEPSRIHGRP